MNFKFSSIAAFSSLAFGLLSLSAKDAPKVDSNVFLNNSHSHNTGLDPSGLILCAGMIGSRGNFEDEIEKEKAELTAKIQKDLDNNLKLMVELTQKQKEYHQYFEGIEKDYNSKTEQIANSLKSGDRDTALSIMKTRITEEDFNVIQKNKESIDKSIDTAKAIIAKQKEALKNIDLQAARLIVLDQFTTIQNQILEIAESALKPIESKSMLEYENLLGGMIARAEAEKEFDNLVHGQERAVEAINAAIENQSVEEMLAELERKIQTEPVPENNPIAQSLSVLSDDDLLNSVFTGLEDPSITLDSNLSTSGDENASRAAALKELGIDSLDQF